MLIPKIEFANLDISSFDTVIDVRSPTEFNEDHISQSINLPVLSDAERALVGKTYKQESRFKARKIGASFIAKNTAKHLMFLKVETAFNLSVERGQRSLLLQHRQK